MRYRKVLQFFKKKQTCVFILGMHRSGTSCLAGSLQQHGLYLGEVFEKNKHNKKGNRENKRIMDLNNQLLKYNNGSWDNPPKHIKWDRELEIERDKIISDFKKQSYSIWGFKDPRTILTLPFWLDTIHDFKFVGSFRNPVSVAKSLKMRNGMNKEKAYILWREYNEKLLNLQKRYLFPLISFDLQSDEYDEKIVKIVKYLELNKSIKNQDEKFFDDSLKNHINIQIDSSIPIEIQMVYKKLAEIYENQEKKN